MPLDLLLVLLLFLLIPFPCASLHNRAGVSPGDRSFLVHVPDLKAIFKCSRILQIGKFTIIKLHEYEDSCGILTMPHGEDVQQNSFPATVTY